MDNRKQAAARRAVYACIEISQANDSRGGPVYTAEAIAAAELLAQERIPGLEVPPQAERLIIKAKQRQDDLFADN